MTEHPRTGGRRYPEVDRAPAETGRAARKRISRSRLGVWEAPPDRVDPIAVLQAQAASRLPELVPIRHARMAAGVFPFLRGAPAIMAADLAASPNTGLTVQLCGDAHLMNFGLYASPERTLVFDLNDFDETLPGPFEWDVKRLAASLAVAARANGFPDAAAAVAARTAGEAYRVNMRRLARLDGLTVWYEQIDISAVIGTLEHARRRKRARRQADAARSRTSLQALRKLTEPDPEGTPRIRHQPPLLVPIAIADQRIVDTVFADYRATLPEERRTLLDRFRPLEIARKVVGVGSVGTQCFIMLLLDRTTGSPLFLQVKEAQRSVLEPYAEPSPFPHQGHRVVHGQRLSQSASDIFLGWATGPQGRFFYWRQLRDMKGSADTESMTARGLTDYGALCGRTLARARARARSGDRVAIAAYLGTAETFDRAMSDFALAYADQTAEDHRALTRAIETGRVEVATES
ncbi:DUF2252 domain-containing protein [Nocardia otitidiscaviarum]|uniref:DUF2252 domain-containing protein n=1 Tax=Nocardia otitidiscaviarum TaxID=1823 RepID=UPI00189409B2|nr:DUF2252 domain-containing protein [Nocardia otitidiscaviarum]MBF6133148.1 DUF2252 domain-containing protein [Nocardia otitidiscaviarum]